MLVALGLSQQLITETLRLDLAHEPFWEVLLGQILLEQVDLHLSTVERQAEFFHQILDLTRSRALNLDLKLVTSAKLILDVLH